MAVDSSFGKKSASAITSTLAWLVLLVAFLATTATLTVNGMSHVGNTASTIVQHLSKNPAAIDSLLNEFRKNADPKTAAEIDKNRAKIDSTIASIGGDKAFQDSLAATLNKISEAILNGSQSVKIDFVPLATAIADKVNVAAKSSIISKKELAKLKPQILDLSKQSKNISHARSEVKEVTVLWLLWLVLLGALYLFKQWKVLGTAGWQLLSVGIIFLALRFAAPFIVHNALNNSAMATFQKDLISEVLKSLTGPMMTLSTVAVLVGLVLVMVDRLLRKRLPSRKNQISPSVVA